MERYGFVYIWYDRKRKMYYIGSHWGTEDDGYICSSNRMRNAYRRRPEDFKRRILSRVYEGRQELLAEEQRWFDRVKRKDRYYNLYWSVRSSDWYDNPEARKTANQKISAANKGRTHPPEVTTKRLETMRRNGTSRKGISFSEEHKAKLSKAHQKEYTFVSPTGETVTTNNLKSFCEENGLGYNTMSSLANGSYMNNTYKGWKSIATVS